MLLSHLLLSAALGAAVSSSASITSKQLLRFTTKSSWLGSSAIALQGAGDPIFMTSTWVYEPTELLGFRPLTNASRPVWVDDTTKDLEYQTLYVASAGALLPPGSVDSLALWNRKPHGTDGDCVLIGFNSASAPDLSFRPARPGSWHANLSSDCNNVNLAVPWSRFALSSDGASAVAWVQGQAGNLSIFLLDGQSGAQRWRVEVPCGTAEQCSYFEALGADISRDGQWVFFDEGQAGSGPHRLHVLSAATGEPRCSPVPSAGTVPAQSSFDGAYLLTSADAAGSEGSGNFSTWKWSAAAKGYVQAGAGPASPPLAPSSSSGWQLAQYAFSSDAASGKVWLGVVWFDASLLGASVLAIFDAADPQRGAVAHAVSEPLPGSDMANSGAVVDCAGSLCAAGFYTQKVGGPQPTLVVLSAEAPSAVWNATLPGSVDAVSVLQEAAGKYYVLAAGCTSLGVCTQPGGDLFGFLLTVA